MRVLHGFFAALFVFAAFVNLNDPDPTRWIAMYLSAAVVCAIAAGGRPWAWKPAVIVGLVAAGWGLTYLPAVLRHGQVFSMFDEWEMRNQEVLENREMFGLLIIAAYMVVVFVGRRKSKPSWGGAG